MGRLLVLALLLGAPARADASAYVLRWKATPGAVRYEIQVAADAGFDRVVLAEATSAQAYRWRNARPGRYFWRVRGFDAGSRPGLWSDVEAIDIAEPQPVEAPPQVAPPADAPPDPPPQRRRRRARVVRRAPPAPAPASALPEPPPLRAPVTRPSPDLVWSWSTAAALSWAEVTGARSYEVELLRSGAPAAAHATDGPSLEVVELDPGRYEWRVRAVAESGTSPWSKAEVFAVVPGRTARIALDSTPPQLVADGRSRHVLAARPLDAEGRLVRGSSLQARAELGQVVEVRETRQGYEITYQAPGGGEEDQVHLVDGRVEATQRIALAAPRGRLSFGIRGGVGATGGGVFAPVLSVEINWEMHPGAGAWGAGVRVSGHRLASEIPSGTLGPSSVSQRAYIACLGLAVLRHWRLPGWTLYGGGAPGVRWTSVSVGPATGVGVRAGFELFAGAERRLGSGRLVVELASSLDIFDHRLLRLPPVTVVTVIGYRYSP